MSGGILHLQVAEVHADREEGNRSFSSGPTLDRQTLYQDKPTPIQYLIQHLPQPRPERRKRNVRRRESRELNPRSFEFFNPRSTSAISTPVTRTIHSSFFVISDPYHADRSSTSGGNVESVVDG
jgi:hypothetical protein